MIAGANRRGSRRGFDLVTYLITSAVVHLAVAIWLLVMVAALLAAGCGANRVGVAGDVSTSIDVGSARSLSQSRLYRVPSGSMEPTLPMGTRVVVKAGMPIVGAIVVYHPPEGTLLECGPKPHLVRPGGAACDAPIPEESKTELIKRVVAGPGDEIYISAGHVYRKASGLGAFVRESDPYIRACGASPDCNFPIPIKIPVGHWFLMGDDRGASDDSRLWGPVPTAWVVGLATDPVLRSRHMSLSIGHEG